MSKVRYLNLQRIYPGWFAEHESETRLLVRQPFFVKGVEYSSEAEVRLVTSGVANQQGVVLDGINPELWMEEIVTSPHLPTSEFEAFKRLVGRSCEKLEGRIRKSRLFEGPPHVELAKTSAAEFGSAFDSYCEQEGFEKLPQFMKLP